MQSCLLCRQKDINRMSGKQKICPKCKKSFFCQADDISACGCSQLSLSNETKSFLSKTFYGCLCSECLRSINSMVAEAGEIPFPGRGGDLIEGLHYYTEDDYRVFTEFYLLSRGYCCRSGCRHCPYGFQKKWAE